MTLDYNEYMIGVNDDPKEVADSLDELVNQKDIFSNEECDHSFRYGVCIFCRTLEESTDDYYLEDEPETED